jgi:DNA-binding transcriptional MocR family regulator
MRSAGPLANRYEFPPGYSPLLREIARRSSIIEGKKVDLADIIITSGAIEGINLALRAALKPGELLAVESPTYYGLLKAAELLGVRIVEIPSDARTGIDLNSLEKAVRQYKIRCIFLMTNFQNPLGSVMPDEKKEDILSLASRYDLTIIEDDVQGDLYFGLKRPLPLKYWDKEGRVIYLSSFSKTIAPGYRLGWIRPGRLYEKVLELKFTFTASTPTLIQMAIAEYLSSGSMERHLKKLRKAFELQVSQMSHAIQEFFPSGTRLSRPMGGFLLWVELPSRVNSIELFKKSSRNGVAICPGPIFSPRGRYSNYARLSCGHPWSNDIQKAVRMLGKIANM